ncbi:MAG: LacI family transcriptional regulator [Epulopiscium sp.]|nr:LacI family transcriptional regulator [Candidatus Epulonipiscium sp.]
MITIKDIAKMANVSTATVSRVLNNNYPVSQEVRERVLNVVKEFNYRPNDVARSLKQKKTYLIGLLVPDISNPYFMEIARGVESVVSHLGYHMLLASTDEDERKELKLLKLFYEKRVEFVVLATRQNQATILNEFIHQGLKLVMVDSEIEGVKADVVVEDNRYGAYQLVQHLIEQGHQKIGIINGLMDISTAQERYQGFHDACIDHKVPIYESYILEGAYNRKKAYDSMVHMINSQSKDLPTAIFSVNNDMTEGVMMACKAIGLQIPNNISLVSFGDIRVPELIEPKLTIIHQNPLEIGQKAGEILLSRISNSTSVPYKKHIISSKIKIGSSVKRI